MNDCVALVAGLACAGIGGELFVRGSVGLAHQLRVRPGIIGATVAAFATSGPELSVAISSALAGRPQISLGDALGSNVANVALVLALLLALGGIRCPRGSLQRDFPVALLLPVATGALLLDGMLSRLDGAMMLAAFAAWLFATMLEARKQRSAAERVLGERRAWMVSLSFVAGLGLLVAAGGLIVAGARGIALSFGVDEFIVGATLVAVGTSTPELATVIVARLRGHDEVGLGTILGSNVFNGMFVAALAAVIHPIEVGWRETGVALVFGLLSVAAAYPSREGMIERRRGYLLLVLFALYLGAIAQQQGS